MVISRHQRIIGHIIIVLHQRCLNCSECFETPYVLYMCNYNIRVTHRNGAIKHIFLHRIRSTEGSSADCSLFILSLHFAALHLAVKPLLQIFLCERFEHVAYIHLSVVFPQNVWTTLLRNQYVSENKNIIFDINHQQNTRRSDQIETIKTIMQTTRPRVSHMEVYQWLRLPFLRVIFDQVPKRFGLLDCFILN